MSRGLTFHRQIASNFQSLGDVVIPLERVGMVAIRGKNLDDASAQENGCLSGDMLVDIPRDLMKYPAGVPLRKLVGKKFWVFAYQDGGIVIRKCVKAILIKKKAKVVRILLSKGFKGHNSKYLPPQELVGTPDHLVLLSDGVTWKRLDQLESGDSLFSMYRAGCIHKNKYGAESRIRWTNGPKRVREARFIASEVYGMPNKKYHIHHKNKNPLDHTPKNLEWLDKFEHLSSHVSERNKLGTAGWRVSGKHPRGMLGKKHSREVKKTIAKNTSKALKNRSNENKKKTAKKISDALTGRIFTKEHRMKLAEAAKRRHRVNHTVISVEHLKEKMDVFDLRVPFADSYIANGVVVHNCGKTSLLDSIVCTLYGRIPRYTKQVNGSQIINRHRGGATCVLELEFSIGNNVYRVRRSYRKNGHKVLLYQNDSDISEASIPRTQEKIIQLVGTYQAFLNSIMFGRGVISRFVKADKVERGEIVASLVMDTESFDEVKKKTEKAYTQAQIDLSLITEKLEAGKIARESKRKGLQYTKDDLKQLQFQNKEELKSLKPPKPVKDTIVSSTKKIQQLACEVDRLKHKRDGLKERINYGFGKLSEMQSYCDILEVRDSSHCPVCLSDISNVQRNKILDRFKHEMMISQVKCEKIQDKSYVLRDKIITLETEIRELKQEQDRVRDELVKYDLTRMAYLNAKSRVSEREAKAWEQLTHAKNAFIDSKAAVKRLVQIQKEFRQKVKDLTFLRKAFSSKGIMAEVVKTVCPKLTMLSQQFVTRFLGGGYQIEFVPELVTFRGEERLSFDIHASVEKGGGEYAACSDGEQERIDTCVGLALRYLVASRFHQQVNLLAFDERFSGLDALGAEKVMELIADEAKNQSSVLVITHQEHLQQFFEKQWIVVKENGIARLETD